MVHINWFDGISTPMIIASDAKNSNNRARFSKQLLTDFALSNMDRDDITPSCSITKRL